MSNYKNIVINSLPDREVEIIGEITAEKMAEMRTKAIKKFKESLEVDGFRKGNAPDTIVVQKVGEMRLAEEAAEIALSEEYPNILDEHKIDAIGRPEVTITKLAPGNPMEFKAKTSIMPEIKLGDYKKLAGSENSKERKTPETSDQEVEDVIKNIRENIAHQKMHADNENLHDHNHGPIKDEDLPAVDDEFAKMIGGFKDVAEMKAKIKENIAKEKELKEKDKQRVDILEAIIKASTIDLPKIIIEGELDKMVAQFKDDVARAGVKYEDYLSHIKKSEDDLRKEWRETAIKRAKSQIVLNEVAKAENITPAEEDIKREMENILAHYKDSERFHVRMYVETFLTNELVFKFLESIN
jgi:FKBP-type peptidyl-prolyl cis-trans isomerase (trigger factor)